MNQIKNQKCPMCFKKTLTLIEDEKEIPYFGKVFIFSMNCSNCKYKVSDLEAATQKEPSKYTFEITKDRKSDAAVVSREASGTTDAGGVPEPEP